MTDGVGARYSMISIHASVREATAVDIKPDNALSISIHASVREATYANAWISEHKDISIHASVREATGSIVG